MDNMTTIIVKVLASLSFITIGSSECIFSIYNNDFSVGNDYYVRLTLLLSGLILTYIGIDMLYSCIEKNFR